MEDHSTIMTEVTETTEATEKAQAGVTAWAELQANFPDLGKAPDLQGLTQVEVQRKGQAGECNDQKEGTGKTFKDILKSNLFTFFNLVNLLIALMILWASFQNFAYIANLFFLLIVGSNTCIGIIQEWQAKKNLENLKILVEPKADVIRDGEVMTISSDELVRGDLLSIKRGMQITCDLEVVRSDSLEMDEALITGESQGVPKRKGDTLVAGSTVLSGTALARVELLSHESEAYRITLEAKEERGDRSILKADLRRLLQLIAAVIFPLGFLLLIPKVSSAADLVDPQGMADIVVGIAGTLLGMIPDGLYLMVSISMDWGASNMGNLGLLCQSLSSLEQLARVDLLCVDKTGTLTTGNMQVSQIFYLFRPGQVRPDRKDLAGLKMVVQDASQDGMKPFQRHSLDALALLLTLDHDRNSTAQALAEYPPLRERILAIGGHVQKDLPQASPLTPDASVPGALAPDVPPAPQPIKHSGLYAIPGVAFLARLFGLAPDRAFTQATASNSMAGAAGDIQASEPINPILSAQEMAEAAAEAAYFSREFAAELPKYSLIPFSSGRKWSGISSPELGKSYLLGAAEFILPQSWQDLQESIASTGKRTVVFAFYDGVLEASGTEVGAQDLDLNKVEPLAYISLDEELRPNVRQTLAAFEQEDVEVKVISGDALASVTSLAQRAGMEPTRGLDCSTPHAKALFKAADSFVHLKQSIRRRNRRSRGARGRKWWQFWKGRPSDVYSPEMIQYERQAKELKDYNIFARVLPRQKQTLVAYFKAEGRYPAMTGDGVNDIPAMKQSDCSIVMASGADATKSVADLVLLNNDFATLVPGTAEGRRIINNITKVASLFLVKTTYSVILALFFVFYPGSPPYYPIHLTFITSFCVGIPSFFLALRPNRDRITDADFMSRVWGLAVPGGIATAVGVMALCGMREYLPMISDQTESLLAITLLVTTGFYVLFMTLRPLNILRIFFITFWIAGFAIAMFYFPQILMISSEWYREWPIMFIGIAAMIALNTLFYWYMGRHNSHLGPGWGTSQRA